jgi:hypothetical protein
MGKQRKFSRLGVAAVLETFPNPRHGVDCVSPSMSSRSLSPPFVPIAPSGGTTAGRLWCVPNRPVFAALLPAFAPNPPVFGALLPAFAVNRPAFAALLPAFAANRPAFAALLPAFAANRPAFAALLPAFVPNPLALVAFLPAFVPNRPVFGALLPASVPFQGVNTPGRPGNRSLCASAGQHLAALAFGEARGAEPYWAACSFSVA